VCVRAQQKLHDRKDALDALQARHSELTARTQRMAMRAVR
jgi:hypothetical protein